MTESIAVLSGHDFLPAGGGSFDLTALRALWAELLRNYPEHCCRLLMDCRGLTDENSYTDVYHLLQEIRQDRRYFSFRIALLYRYIEDTSKAEFLAYAGRLAGIRIRLFVEEEAALDWLASDDETYGWMG